MKRNVDEIRKAVRRRHGGFDQADDATIMRLWRTFDQARQARYLSDAAGFAPQGKKQRAKEQTQNATSIRPDSDSQVRTGKRQNEPAKSQPETNDVSAEVPDSSPEA